MRFTASRLILCAMSLSVQARACRVLLLAGQLALGASLADSLCRRATALPQTPSRTLAYWLPDEQTRAPYILDAFAYLDNRLNCDRK